MFLSKFDFIVQHTSQRRLYIDYRDLICFKIHLSLDDYMNLFQWKTEKSIQYFYTVDADLIRIAIQTILPSFSLTNDEVNWSFVSSRGTFFAQSNLFNFISLSSSIYSSLISYFERPLGSSFSACTEYSKILTNDYFVWR